MQLVSIVITCYNQASYVKDTINSVLSQTYVNWECIIVNDGSVDSSEEVILNSIVDCEKFIYIVTKNYGVVSARNTGMTRSNGDFLVSLDGDDIIEPDFLKRCINVFYSCKNARLVYTQAVFFGKKMGLWNLPNYSFKDLLRSNLIPNTAMFRKSDYLRIGGYRSNMRLGLEDWDFWINILSIYDDDVVYKVEEVLFKYRIVHDSRTAVVNDIENFNTMLDMIFFNNFLVYRRFYGSIHDKIVNYELLYQVQNKFIVRKVVSCLHFASQFKTYLISLFK